MEAFQRVTAFVEQVAEANGVARDAVLRLTLVLEELFTNTVVHGHGGDCDAPVFLALEVSADRIAVTYEDTAPPFDPFAAVPEPPGDSTSLEDRRVGGLGVLLVATMGRDVGYARAGDRNRITLVLTPPR